MFHHGHEKKTINKIGDLEMESFETHKACWKVNFSQIYSTFVVFILWLNVIRMLFIFRDVASNSLDVIIKFTAIIWNVICTIQCTTVYVMCTRQRNNIWNFYNQLQSLDPETFRELLKLVRRKCVISAIITWILFLLSFFFNVYITWFTDKFDYTTVPISAKSQYVNIMKGLNTVLQFYLNAAWLFPQAFRNMMCTIIYHLFKCLNERFAKMRVTVDISSNIIIRFRKDHRVICKLLDTADQIFHVMTGCSIALYVVILCLMFYQILWNTDIADNHVLVGMYIFWVAGGLVMLGFISLGGAIVHQEVSAY